MLQYRPRTTATNLRTAFYSPERDIAYIGTKIIREGLKLIEDGGKDFLECLLEKFEISDKALVDAVKKLGHTLCAILLKGELEQALDSYGFNQIKPEIRALLFSAIGCAFFAAVWSGVRDVHSPSNTPPASVEELIEYIQKGLEQL